MGDGGSGGDPGQPRAEREVSCSGKILRIDVDRRRRPTAFQRTIRSPTARRAAPRSARSAAQSVAVLVRSRDRRPLIGDVGQDAWEEVDRLPAGTRRRRELRLARHRGHRTARDVVAGPVQVRPALTPPLLEYSHDEAARSPAASCIAARRCRRSRAATSTPTTAGGSSAARRSCRAAARRHARSVPPGGTSARSARTSPASCTLPTRAAGRCRGSRPRATTSSTRSSTTTPRSIITS